MSGFLYFVPGVKTAKDAVKTIGTSCVCSAGCIQREAAGPDKKTGCVIAPKPVHEKGAAARCGYFPDTQDWTSVKKGAYWIGTEKKSPPLPVDLQKREFIRGYEIELKDGHTWTIPVARLFDGGSTLPESLILGPDGEIVSEILPEYARYGAMADHLWQILQSEHGGSNEKPAPMSNRQAYSYASRAIEINYMCNEWGVSKLKLLTTENILTVLHAIVDFPLLKEISIQAQEAAKKKEKRATPDTAGSSGGETGSSPDTGPRLQSGKSSDGSSKEA